MFPLDASEKDIILILKSCEAYGRFALHKEASKDGPPRLSMQARTLLDWTTDRVIPVLSKQIAGEMVMTPFGELNISRISAASTSPVHPASPSPMPPPRQRTNRNSTPGRDSFCSVEEEIDITAKNDSTALLAHGVAVSLLQTSCVIFSEWLAVGGSGSDVIAASACNWCKIFSVSKDKTLQSELLPAFTRLVIQLCKTSSNFSVLEKLIASCDEIETEEGDSVDLTTTVSNLLKGRDDQGNALADGIVTAVLGAASLLLANSVRIDEAPQAMPLALSELWDIEEGSVFSSLSAVLSNKAAAMILAQKLVARFASDGAAADQTQQALFEAKLLWLLCDKISGSNAEEIKAVVVRGLHENKFIDGDDAVSGVLRNVAESLSV